MKKLVCVVGTLSMLLVAAPGRAALHSKQFRILDLNISGSEGLQGVSGPIAAFIRDWATGFQANVITLQEVCTNQHTAILNALQERNPAWTGTWKSFGEMPGCYNKRHGLSVFTLGPHSDLSWDRLDDKTNSDGYRWWGIMRVRYASVDIFNTHIRDFSKADHIPKVAAFVEQSARFLLAGDFNSTPSSQLMADNFYYRWYEADYEDNEYTIGRRDCPLDISCWATQRKIDYVWTNRLPIAISADVVHSPSNHRMVTAVIEHWILD
jgi:endonuclease/exonuclease/phosphatase family metal-dependent hydrolase